MEDEVRIGFTGAGGTGKTTTLELVKEECGLPPLPSTTRAVFAAFGVEREEDQDSMTPTERRRLQDAVFAARLAKESEMPSFVSDRTLLDNYAYSLVRCSSTYTDDDVERIEGIVGKNLERYDALFYFPITFKPPKDGMRQGGMALGRLIDSVVKDFLSRKEIFYVEVPSGEPSVRSAFVLRAIAAARAATSAGLRLEATWLPLT